MSDPTAFTLDARQRAMLEEMHIKVWLPTAAPAVSPVLPVASKNEASSPDLARAGAASFLDAPAAVVPAVPAVSADTRAAAVAAMTWPELQTAVAGCQACRLCQSRQNPVLGAGQPPAAPGLAPRVDWMVVGEAPDEDEDRLGEPFVGQVGKLLDSMLGAIALERHTNIYMAHVLKCRPPANRNPEPGELAQCLPFLQRQVALLQPRVILAMGRLAVQALLQTSEPIGKLRGRVHHPPAFQGVPVIGTYHPAYLLRNPSDKARAWADLVLALSVMAQPTT